MNKRILLGAVVAAVIAGFAYVGVNRGTVQSPPVSTAPSASAAAVTQPGAKKQLEKINFRLSWVHDLAYAGLYIAKDKGFFEEEGLDVTLQPGGFGLDPIKQVATGADSFGIAGAGNVLMARTQGIPVVAIGAYFQVNGVGFMTRKDSGITSFKQFKGKRVGIQTGSDTDTLYRALLVRNGLTPKDVKEIPIQYDMVPFLTKQIDVLPGYVTNQPITLRGQGVETNVITAASEGVRFYGSAFITSESLIREKPETVAKFMRAMAKGWKVFFENKDEAVAAARKWAPEFDPKDLPHIYDAAMPLIKGDTPELPINGMVEERWKVTEKVLRDAGLLKGELDLSKAFTTQFLSR